MLDNLIIEAKKNVLFKYSNIFDIKKMPIELYIKEIIEEVLNKSNDFSYSEVKNKVIYTTKKGG